MPDLDSSVTIHGDDDLLIDTGDYELIGVGVSGRTWRRTTVEGRYQPGRALVGAVVDTATIVLVVRCKGSTWVETTNRYQALVDATSPFTYQVTVVIDGQSLTYTCEPADINTGDTIDKYRAHAHMLEATLTIPCDPQAVTP